MPQKGAVPIRGVGWRRISVPAGRIDDPMIRCWVIWYAEPPQS